MTARRAFSDAPARWLPVCALAAVCVAAACGSPADDAAAWIGQAAADSAAAERASQAGHPEEAAARLERVVARPVPAAVAEDDARVVRQDAYDRLARFSIDRGDLAAAARFVERGLEQGQRADLFTANLLTTRGRVREATGRDREAARDYHRALRIHEGLLERVLEGEER